MTKRKSFMLGTPKELLSRIFQLNMSKIRLRNVIINDKKLENSQAIIFQKNSENIEVID